MRPDLSTGDNLMWKHTTFPILNLYNQLSSHTNKCKITTMLNIRK